MATIRKRKINKKEYYYLEHSIKNKGKVEKREKYLGKTIPKNIGELKAEFMHEIYKENWFKDLGEIRKNFTKEHQRMPEAGKKKYAENFMVKFTYNTNRIEGSTLTLRETADLLEDGITPANKSAEDVKETEAHKKVFYQMFAYKGDLTLQKVLEWHKELLGGTKPEIAGKIRSHQVAITGAKVELPLPVELEFLLRGFFKWYHKNKGKTQPVELAALVHLKFVSIHPFTDGNGRISRLMMNFVLHKHKYPMLNIPYKNRSAYYTALERSQTKKIAHSFIRFVIKSYLKMYRKYFRN